MKQDALLSLNKYNTPEIIDGLSLINLQIIRLLLYEPGTSPDFPDKGFGLASKYRYMKVNELSELERDIERHISFWLPGLEQVTVSLELKNHILHIGIAADEVFYEYTYDGTSLKNKTVNDIKLR